MVSRKYVFPPPVPPQIRAWGSESYSHTRFFINRRPPFSAITSSIEIRLKNERAYYAVRDLLTYYDAERTAFSIINRYVRFVDKEADKKRSDWKLSVRWAWFIGENREPLKLTTKPEPYTLDRTLRWIQRQVDPTLKMLETITAKTGIDYLKEIRKSTKLTEKHYKIIEQQTTSTEDVILEKEN